MPPGSQAASERACGNHQRHLRTTHCASAHAKLRERPAALAKPLLHLQVDCRATLNILTEPKRSAWQKAQQGACGCAICMLALS